MEPSLVPRPIGADPYRPYNGLCRCSAFDIDRYRPFEYWCRTAPTVWHQSSVGAGLDRYSRGRFRCRRYIARNAVLFHVDFNRYCIFWQDYKTYSEHERNNIHNEVNHFLFWDIKAPIKQRFSAFWDKIEKKSF